MEFLLSDLFSDEIVEPCTSNIVSCHSNIKTRFKDDDELPCKSPLLANRCQESDSDRATIACARAFVFVVHG